jgi:hypothetical protein
MSQRQADVQLRTCQIRIYFERREDDNGNDFTPPVPKPEYATSVLYLVPHGDFLFLGWKRKKHSQVFHCHATKETARTTVS